jgi:hypothetical protein
VSTQTPDFQGQTVQQFFNAHQEVVGLAGNLIDTLYVRGSAWAGLDAWTAASDDLHEIMHFLGIDDDKLGDILLPGVYHHGDPTEVFGQLLGNVCIR